MLTLISIVHIVVALFLVLLVLIQDSKGGGLGMMGGGSQSILGTTGADNIIAKATRWTALVFAGTCVALTLYSSQASRSVIDSVGLPPASSALPVEKPDTTAPSAAPEAPASEKTGN